MPTDNIDDKLEIADDKEFLKLYKELQERIRIAKEKFERTAIYYCFKRTLETYTPRYEKLTK